MEATDIKPKQIGVGVGVFILNAARTHFVLGKRIGSVGSGKMPPLTRPLLTPSYEFITP
jgi:hypothetical protein